MLLSRRSPLVLSFPCLPVTYNNSLGIIRSAPIIVGITVTFMFHSLFYSRSRYLSLFSLSLDFTLWSAGMVTSTIWQVLFLSFFYCWPWLGLVIWPRLGDLFVSQNSKEICGSHSPRRILGCACTFCSYGLISISCTIPSGLPSRLSCLLYIDHWPSHHSRDVPVSISRRRNGSKWALWKNIGRCRRQLSELVTGSPEWGPTCKQSAVALTEPRLSNSSQDAEEMLLWSGEKVGSI